MLGQILASLNVVTAWLDGHASDDYTAQPMAMDMWHILAIELATADATKAYALMSQAEPDKALEGDRTDVVRALCNAWCRSTIAILHFSDSTEQAGQWITEAVREHNRRMVQANHMRRIDNVTTDLL